MQQQFKSGRQIEHDRLINAMFEAAIGGNVAAGCFLLKSRHNYNDKGDGNAATPNKLSITQNNTITFTLPRALTMEEYMRKLAATTEAISPADAERLLAQPGMKSSVIRQSAAQSRDAGVLDGEAGSHEIGGTLAARLSRFDEPNGCRMVVFCSLQSPAFARIP